MPKKTLIKRKIKSKRGKLQYKKNTKRNKKIKKKKKKRWYDGYGRNDGNARNDGTYTKFI